MSLCTGHNSQGFSLAFVFNIGLIAGIDAGCGPASPLGALQPDLYHRPEGPIFLTAPDQNVALGKLHLRVNYDSHVSDLAVHLIEGTYMG